MIGIEAQYIILWGIFYYNFPITTFISPSKHAKMIILDIITTIEMSFSFTTYKAH